MITLVFLGILTLSNSVYGFSMAYISRKKKRGRIIMPVIIILMLFFVVSYKLRLDDGYHISINVVNKEGVEHNVSNKDIREYLDTKAENGRQAASNYFESNPES